MAIIKGAEERPSGDGGDWLVYRGMDGGLEPPADQPVQDPDQGAVENHPERHSYRDGQRTQLPGHRATPDADWSSGGG